MRPTSGAEPKGGASFSPLAGPYPRSSTTKSLRARYWDVGWGQAFQPPDTARPLNAQDPNHSHNPPQHYSHPGCPRTSSCPPDPTLPIFQAVEEERFTSPFYDRFQCIEKVDPLSLPPDPLLSWALTIPVADVLWTEDGGGP